MGQLTVRYQTGIDNPFVRWSNLIACLYGLWLSLDLLFPLLVPLGVDVQNGLFLMLGAGIATLHATLLRPPIHRAGYALVFFGGLTGIFIMTMLVNAGSISSAKELLVILPMVFVMLIGLLVASEPSVDFLRVLFASFAIGGGCATLFYIWLYAGLLPDFDARMQGHLNPNAFGMICAAIACASLALRIRAVQLLTISVACLGLYLAQSRSNMLGVAVGYSAVGLLFVLRAHAGGRLRLAVAVCTGAVILAFFFSTSFADFVRDDLLYLDDPHRGLGTGATNRSAAWLRGIELWMASPLFGYGYRANERLYEDFGVGSTHNGYIALLIDLGVIGLLAYLLLVGIAIKRALQQLARPTAGESAATAAFLFGYLVMAVFERYALNAGNAASILLVITCFRWISCPTPVGAAPQPAVRRVAG